jgi:septal ring factor EnvC (AmiA/AmiB activator)
MEIIERLKEIIQSETDTNINVRTRKRETVEARSLYCSILKQLHPNKTFQSIGESIELNHATIIHALRMYNIYEKSNPELKHLRNKILSNFIEVEQSQNTKEENEIYNLRFNNVSLTKQIKELEQKPVYKNKTINKLNSLMEQYEGTEQQQIIIDRLEAFHRMNNNIKI